MAFLIEVDLTEVRGEKKTFYARPNTSPSITKWPTGRITGDILVQYFDNAEQREGGVGVNSQIFRRVPLETETPTQAEIYAALKTLPTFAHVPSDET